MIWNERNFENPWTIWNMYVCKKILFIVSLQTVRFTTHSSWSWRLWLYLLYFILSARWPASSLCWLHCHFNITVAATCKIEMSIIAKNKPAINEDVLVLLMCYSLIVLRFSHNTYCMHPVEHWRIIKCLLHNLSPILNSKINLI